MHLRTRLTLGVATTAAAVGALLIPATNAFAAPALTATPSTSLYDQAVTQISGSGLPPSTTLALVECNLQTAQTIGLDDPNVVFEACSTDNAVLTATTDASGNLPPTPITLETGQLGTDPTSVCDYSTNGQCVVAAGDQATFQLIAYTPIAFSQIVVTPATNLTDGQHVSVSGAGLPASTSVAVLECNVANGQDSSNCNTSGVAIVQTDASGNLPATDMVVKTGQLGTNPDGVCTASTNGACGFAVGDINTQQPLGFGPITIAPVHVSTKLTIASTKGSVGKGDKFAIKGRDTAGDAGVNGVTVKLQSRTNKDASWSTIDKTTTATKNGKAGSYKFGGLTEKKTLYYRTKSVKKTTADTIYNAATSGAVKVKFTG